MFRIRIFHANFAGRNMRVFCSVRSLRSSSREVWMESQDQCQQCVCPTQLRSLPHPVASFPNQAVNCKHGTWHFVGSLSARLRIASFHSELARDSYRRSKGVRRHLTLASSRRLVSSPWRPLFPPILTPGPELFPQDRETASIKIRQEWLRSWRCSES
jgi:hypothetical protein